MFTYSGSYTTIYQMSMYLYVRIYVSEKLTNSENSTRRRKTTRARSSPLLAGSGGASKLKHVQQSEVDLISI